MGREVRMGRTTWRGAAATNPLAKATLFSSATLLRKFLAACKGGGGEGEGEDARLRTGVHQKPLDEREKTGRS